jgi:hypothetical protein
MKIARTITLALVIFCLVSFVAQADVTDPYQILQKYYEAIGGLEKIKAQKTRHSRGSFEIEGTGFEGTFEEWTQRPIKI